MKKLAAAAVIPIFAGFLCAQQSNPAPQTTETQTTTTTTTFNGTLVDAGCQATHTENKETTSTDQAGNTTTTKTKTETIECPVTTTTTSFGLLTSDGKFVRFDEPSNTKVVEMVKSNRAWKREMEGKKPVKVRVVGTANGDVVVVESIK